MRRPAEDEREVLAEATLDPVVGLVGDLWPTRGSSRTPDGSAHPGMQLTLDELRARRRSSPVIVIVWPLAGDQLYVDLDLSDENLTGRGQRLAVGYCNRRSVGPTAHRFREVRRAVRS